MKNIHTLTGALFLLFTSLYIVLEDKPIAFFHLVILFIAQGATIWAMFKLSDKFSSLRVWRLAIVAYFLVAFSQPIFEDDYWRYLWDGRVIAAEINPYIHAPDSKALDHLHTEYRKKINYLHIKTIYPPVAQYIFAFNVNVFGESLLGLKIIFIFFHLLTGFVLVRWLALRGGHPKWILLYLLHPTPLKEIANSAHVDSVMVFFLVFSAYLIDKTVVKSSKNELVAWFFLGLSVLTKIIPLALVPSYFASSKKPWKGMSVLFLTLVLFSLPFLGAGTNFISGLVPFSKYWVTNESLFYPISYLVNKFLLALNLSQDTAYMDFINKEYPARIVVALVFITLIAYRFFVNLIQKNIDIAHEALWVITSLLLLAPTFNPWYSLWILPFAVVKKNIPLIVLPGLTVLSYGWYWSEEAILKIQFVEYILFFGIFYYFNFWKTKHT